MSFPTQKCIADRSAWRVKDPAWVADRKAQWARLSDKIDALHLTARERKIVEKYFMTGASPNPTIWHVHECPSVPLLFRLWLHPDQSESNWDAQLRATVWDDYHETLRLLINLWDDNGPGLDGAEKRWHRVLLGGPTTRSFLGGGYYRGVIEYEERSISSWRGFPGSVVHTLALVLELNTKNPRVASRYKISELLDDVTHKEWRDVFEEPSRRKRLMRLFDLVRFKASSFGESASTPGQVELAKELLALFDEGRGPEHFQQLWQEHGRSDGWKKVKLPKQIKR
jgi:hypothetical protein